MSHSSYKNLRSTLHFISSCVFVTASREMLKCPHDDKFLNKVTLDVGFVARQTMEKTEL
jgi:hypothetical protein